MFLVSYNLKSVVVNSESVHLFSISLCFKCLPEKILKLYSSSVFFENIKNTLSPNLILCVDDLQNSVCVYVCVHTCVCKHVCVSVHVCARVCVYCLSVHMESRCQHQLSSPLFNYLFYFWYYNIIVSLSPFLLLNPLILILFSFKFVASFFIVCYIHIYTYICIPKYINTTCSVCIMLHDTDFFFFFNVH